jgi:very-long-chain (3R)-3-hydroxyacyl-CoA dehydratase
LGAGSEWALIYAVLPHVQDPWNFVLAAILLMYVPGFYHMYTHMIGQRRKYLKAGIKTD